MDAPAASGTGVRARTRVSGTEHIKVAALAGACGHGYRLGIGGSLQAITGFGTDESFTITIYLVMLA
jgi:hypothetical protein